MPDTRCGESGAAGAGADRGRALRRTHRAAAGAAPPSSAGGASETGVPALPSGSEFSSAIAGTISAASHGVTDRSCEGTSDTSIAARGAAGGPISPTFFCATSHGAVRGEPLSRELESEEAEVIELGVGATKRSVGARELTVSIACEPPTSTVRSQERELLWMLLDATREVVMNVGQRPPPEAAPASCVCQNSRRVRTTDPTATPSPPRAAP
jgi:hypothetical protein